MITLLHPSRGRAQKALDTYNYWMDRASGEHNIEHILSIDNDDVQRESYLGFKNSLVIPNDNIAVVDATNKAAKFASGDILVYLSDDFKCPQNWDQLIFDKMKPKIGPALLKVDDCLQKFDVAVLTIPIMNRQLYEKLGYFWHPDYKSMFVDEDLYWTCSKNNWIIEARDLMFPHEHCANGKAPNDETYKRSSANWDQGKEAFRKRKLANFPL
jgi:hypothetical protein